MVLTRKDVVATVLTALAVLVFAATHEGWNVWLIGDSRRWAAGAIVLLGILTCAVGAPPERRLTRVLSVLGAVALVLSVVALVTGSLTVLSVLVADIVLLWAGATIRHALDRSGRPLAA